MESTERAVVRLTEHHTEMTEAGAVEWPPLLVWLERSVTEMVKRGGAGSGGAGIPIDFEALHLLDSIKKEASSIRAGFYLPRRGNDLVVDVADVWKVTKRLHAFNELDDSTFADICDQLEGWAFKIESEQGVRSRKMELTVPCPRCGHRWILDGEERKAAVVIEFSEGRAPVAECRVNECDAMWAGWAQVAQLGFIVGASSDLAVLEACGIDTAGIMTAV